MDSEKELEGLEREEASEKLAGSSLPPEMMARLTRARETRKVYELNKNKRILYEGGAGGAFGTDEQITNNKRPTKNLGTPADSDDIKKSVGNNGNYQSPYEGNSRSSQQTSNDDYPTTNRKNKQGAEVRNQEDQEKIEANRWTKTGGTTRSYPGSEGEKKNREPKAIEKTTVGKFFNVYGNIKKGRAVLGTTSVFLMLSTFLLFDLTQAVLNLTFVGVVLVPIVDIVAILTMYVWFRGKGVNLASPKRLKRMLVGALIDVVPVLDALPVWTGTVISIMGTLEAKPQKQVPVVNSRLETKNVGQEQYKQAA